MKVDESKFLIEMYHDNYYPDHLVDQGKDVLLKLCRDLDTLQINSIEDVYPLTHVATEKFNALQDAFHTAGSEIETVARESIAESFDMILKALNINYDPQCDLEEAIGPRDW